MKYVFALLSFLCLPALMNAQDLQAQFYQAYLNNSIEIWKNGIAQLEARYKKTQNDDLLLEIANAAYGSIGTCFAKQDNDTAEKMVDKTEKTLEKFLKTHKEHPDALALMAGTMGMKIALSPMKGMFLGPKSDEYIEKALQFGPASPRVHYQKGSSLYYTPSMFGGDKEKAIAHLIQSKTFHEKCSINNNWEYLVVLATLGQAYQGIGKLEKAEEIYALALEQEPNYGWVKFQLLPALQKEIAEKG